MSEQFTKFITAQRHALDRAIYLDSQREKRDLRYDCRGNLTDTYFLEWIDEHAGEFCDAWETSLCKKCKHVLTCYDCLRDSCDSFSPCESSKNTK
jgi:hypothetical protein